jgi:hypothetical protein
MRPINHSCAILMAGILALTLTSSLLDAEPATNDLGPAWRLGAQGLFAEASEAVSPNATGEEAEFSRAVLLFNRQPRTDADLTTAINALSALGANGLTAELRARSLYYAARAETLRRRDEPAQAAAPGYERVWRDYPAEPYGQRALVHLLLLAFYTDEPRETILAHCATIELQAEALTDLRVRSHFHQVAARGYLHLGGENAKALEHLLQVSALGVSRREALGDLHVSIGQIAAEQGRPALAREHYAAFLKDFPNDPRAYTVKAFLAALPE